MVAPTLLDALSAALRSDPGRPLVTFYDDATGERVELSVKTFDNWVSKVSNLFTDEIGAEPGDGVSVALPTHWLSPAIVAGAWSAGLTLSAPQEAVVRVVGPGEVDAAGAGPDVATVACSLRPLGGRFLEPLPSGWLDFAVEVPPQPDVLLAPQAVRDADPAVTFEHPRSHGALVDAGAQQASVLGLEAGGRLATDLNPADPAGLVTALAAPLAVSASVVLVVNATPERRAVIADQERVSCLAWSD
jgi:uncharacterized protein (TIGR03089 family)